MVSGNRFRLLGLAATFAALPAWAQLCANPAVDGTQTALSGVINRYFPSPATGTVTVAAGAVCVPVDSANARGAAGTIGTNDLLLIVQMQDATIDSSNSNNYGATAGTGAGATNYQGVGRYEYVVARGAIGTNSCAANTIPITGAGTGNGLINAYRRADRATTRGRGRYQVVRVPQYRNVTLAGQIEALYWNGETGGILVMDVAGTLTVNGQTINASERGFRGGGIRQLGGGAGADTDYRTASTVNDNGSKAEGVAGTPLYVFNQETLAVATFGTDEGYDNGSYARGAPGNAGGGGTDGNQAANDENSGGGGGGNSGAGGRGGNTWASNLDRGGVGGAAFAAAAFDRVIAGGGGGSGSRNNSSGALGSGAAGGGLILVQSGLFKGTGSILANGAVGRDTDNDGAGGGGAGGTIVLRDDDTSAFSVAVGIAVRANGGDGGDAWAGQAPAGTPGERHGPGGGGGGGRIWYGPLFDIGPTQINGGVAGITTTVSDTYGAQPGANGSATGFTGNPPGAWAGYRCVKLPVALSYFEAQADVRGMRVAFRTATEVGNVGFRVLDAVSRQPLGTQLVPSVHTNSTQTSAYETILTRAPASGRVYLAEYDIHGNEQVHGPFDLGRSYGNAKAEPPIDWRSARSAMAASTQAKSISTAAKLSVRDTGFQRVGFDELIAAGVDLSGATAASLALTLDGQAVARRTVMGTGSFGPGDSIEFYGEATPSLYSASTVYVLEVDATRALPLNDDASAAGTPAPAWYRATASYAPERQYNFASPTGDPWYADRILAYSGTPATLDLSLTASSAAQVAGVSSVLRAALIGVTAWPGDSLDHHVRLSIDGTGVAETRADGIAAFDLQAQFASGQLADASHQLRLELPGDTGFDFDLVNLDAVTLSYPRLPVATAGSWTSIALITQPAPVNGLVGSLPPPAPNTELAFRDGFEDATPAAGASFVVDGLDASDVVAYRRDAGGWRRLLDVRVAAGGNGYRAFVPVRSGSNDGYWVSTTAALQHPQIAALPALEDIRNGSAAYLVITHAAFRDHLGPLLAQRHAQGLTTAVVDVAQIYRQFGGARATPQAITDYIRSVAAPRGVRYVVLVGADTYDYNDYLGVGSISFVPTPYVPTGVVSYTPADVLYGDLDGDGAPELPVGRLPVRTAGELDGLIGKILAYENGGSAHTALLVAGGNDDSASFGAINDAFAQSLATGYSLSRAYVEQLGAVGARQAMLDGLAQSPGLVSFVGHSAPSQWTFDPLLIAGDIASIGNAGHPALVLQWGCWNTYFVSPSASTMAHALLLDPNRGAAAVFGAVALSETASHQALGELLYPALVPGRTIGDALLIAKRALAARSSNNVDVLWGTALLGDPAMPVR